MKITASQLRRIIVNEIRTTTPTLEIPDISGYDGGDQYKSFFEKKMNILNKALRTFEDQPTSNALYSSLKKALSDAVAAHGHVVQQTQGPNRGMYLRKQEQELSDDLAAFDGMEGEEAAEFAQSIMKKCQILSGTKALENTQGYRRARSSPWASSVESSRKKFVVSSKNKTSAKEKVRDL
jgi:hypothetical protein